MTKKKESGFTAESRLEKFLEAEPDTITLEDYKRRLEEDAKQFIPLLPRIGAIY